MTKGRGEKVMSSVVEQGMASLVQRRVVTWGHPARDKWLCDKGQGGEGDVKCCRVGHSIVGIEKGCPLGGSPQGTGGCGATQKRDKWRGKSGCGVIQEYKREKWRGTGG